jgi:hypothetical protein
MIVRFATYEEAGIYAAWRRSEGYYSAILDEHMGFIYGPLAIGGFRVLVSAEPVEDEEEKPPDEPALLGNIADGIRLVVAAFVSLGLISLLILVLQHPAGFAAEVIPWLLFCVVMAAVFLCLSPLMIAMTRALRDERSLFGGCIRALVVVYVLGNWLLMLAALGYAIWSEAHGHSYY